jgi:hypothetical protein
MKYAFVLLALALAVLPAGAQAVSPLAFAAAPVSAFQANGKYLHFLAGMAIGLATAGAWESFQSPDAVARRPLVLPAVALAGSALAGAAKEALDATGFGDPRFLDVLITLSGGLVAAGTVGYAESAYPASSDGRTNGVTLLLSTAALLAVPVIIGFVKEIGRALDRRRAAQRQG